MWHSFGTTPRPKEFWSDSHRKLLLKNRERPDWVPELKFSNVEFQKADAFQRPVYDNNDNNDICMRLLFLVKVFQLKLNLQHVKNILWKILICQKMKHMNNQDLK